MFLFFASVLKWYISLQMPNTLHHRGSYAPSSFIVGFELKTNAVLLKFVWALNSLHPVRFCDLW